MFDKSKFKTACIFHAADFDGHLSGALIRYHNKMIKNEDVLMVSADYHYDPQVIENDILGCDTVYIVDFSLVNDAMLPMFLRMIDRGVKIFWFDHHMSAIDRFMELKERIPDILDKLEHVILYNGIAACRLVYAYLSSIEEDNFFEKIFKNEKKFCFNYKGKTEDYGHLMTADGNLIFGGKNSIEEPKFVEYLGKYDVFDKSDLDEWEKKILPFQYGLRVKENTTPKTMNGFSVWLKIFDRFRIFEMMSKSDFIDDMDMVNSTIEKGITILQYQKKMATGYSMTYGYDAMFLNEIKCRAINVGQANSTYFDSINSTEFDYKLFVSWVYKPGVGIKVSLFKPDHSDVKCNELAAMFGGGGHVGAAGFTCTFEKFKTLGLLV